MLTTRTALPWTAIIGALCALVAIALLCAWQGDAALQIAIDAALLLGGVVTVLLLDRE